MGFRARKTFKVMPGVRMTVTPRGVSTSIGNKYARVRVNSTGRTTTTLRMPGTGVTYVNSASPGRSSARSTSRTNPPPSRPPAVTPTPSAPQPGLFAPRWEKELVKALAADDYSLLPQIAQTHPAARHICMTLDGFTYNGPDKDARARPIFEELWQTGYEPATDPFLRKYVAEASVTIAIAPGIEVHLPLSRDAIGLCLAELRQGAGDLDGAIAVVEQLDPSAPAAVSLAELYAQQGRWPEVVALTDGLDASDSFRIYLLIQRGAALRALGYHAASREALKTALAARTATQALKHQAWSERARTYEAEGKKALARKDLERIFADDATYPGLREALTRLTS